MHGRKLHLHSMLVHSVLALLPAAGLAFVFAAIEARIGSIGVEVWRFLLTASLLIVFLVALPAMVSGVLERSHHYATWHRTHRLKLALSLALVALLVGELAGLLGGGTRPVLVSPLGAMIVVGNPVVAFGLSTLGLKMTLGRQALSRTSYRPNLFQNPPIDALAVNAAALGEPPDLIDILQEANP